MPVEGEFLTADDFGELGRLLAPGEERVFVSRQIPELESERLWIHERYIDACRKADKMRKRLRTAHMGGSREQVRDAYEAWALEAAKLALCHIWLGELIKMLGSKPLARYGLAADFKWSETQQIRDLTEKVRRLTDAEIAGGPQLRAA